MNDINISPLLDALFDFMDACHMAHKKQPVYDEVYAAWMARERYRQEVIRLREDDPVAMATLSVPEYIPPPVPGAEPEVPE